MTHELLEQLAYLRKRLADADERLRSLATAKRRADEAAREAAEDNDLLLRQLHQAQHELEQYYLRNEELTGEKLALEQQLEARARETAEFDARLQALNARLEARMRDIASIKRSVSWRITAPLRALLAPFAGGARRNSGRKPL